ncbi:hypothetical protein [Acinetobacter ursingii]|uniref:hypothetical protein n=1 Tax=Acinetobacter ursingii TaxID=108980 RepID=UPI00124DF99D|nr:hypothetical protein [Acinetobacter ursingii]MCH2004031.1 hypothetical protein [Acinetobacter ursingii]
MSGLVKHFQNYMKNIPQLSNNWGSMINLLDKVLVEGFNFVPIISVVKSSSDAITATISLGSGHGFIDRQVVRIAGSTNGWDGDYKVLSANTDSVVVECAATNPIAINGAASCSTAPLDFEIVFRTPVGSTEPKRAYRSKDPESLGLILLVHDFCVSGAAASGAKFAKVGVVSSMSDIDTITGTQMPYDSSNPNANWGWDGTYHGWAKWYYRTRSNSSNNDYGSNSDSAMAGNSVFNIVGNSKSFAIDLVHSNYNAFAVYAYFEFYDNKIKGNNLAILASGIQTKVPQNYQYFYHWAMGGYHLCNEDTNESVSGAGLKLNGMMWFNENAIALPQKMGRNLTFGSLNQSNPFGLINLKIVASLPIFDSNNEPRGIIPFVKITANQNVEVTVSEIGKYVNRYGVGSSEKFVKYALLMEMR